MYINLGTEWSSGWECEGRWVSNREAV